MKWEVKISGKSNYKIRIDYEPVLNKLIFTGLYKPKNKPWIEMHVDESEVIFDLNSIVEILYDVTYNLDNKVNNFNDFNNTFLSIEEIEVSGISDSEE